VRELKAFSRVAGLAPGATKTVTLSVKAADIAYWNTAAQAFVVEKMIHQLYVGPSANPGDPNMKTATFTVQ